MTTDPKPPAEVPQCPTGCAVHSACRATAEMVRLGRWAATGAVPPFPAGDPPTGGAVTTPVEPGPMTCKQCGVRNVPACRVGWATPVCFWCVNPRGQEGTDILALSERLQRENAELREKLEAAEATVKIADATLIKRGGECTDLRAQLATAIQERDDALGNAASWNEAQRVTREALDTARAETAAVTAQLAEARRTIAQQEAEACRRIGRNATLASSLREAEAREAELRALLERWTHFPSTGLPDSAVKAIQTDSEAWLRDHPVALPKETK